MSWHPCEEPRCAEPTEAVAEPPPVETLIVPRARDIGGFEVRRALPSAQRQMVGPFIFFDQMGPAEFLTGQGIDVRPHPHIGLATLTYLLEGEILHRDSLGTLQPIRPGEVNLMTAGQGIVHSERTAAELRQQENRLFGLQSWIALPQDQEEIAPAFSHHKRDTLPIIAGDGAQVRLVVGELYGERSPVPSFSPMFYADAQLDAGAKLPLDADHEDRGLYIVAGEIAIGQERYGAGQLLVLRPGVPVMISATQASRVMLMGGATLEGPRYIWWNFVSSRKERIEQAKQDWQAGHFSAVPGDGEFIPLPER